MLPEAEASEKCRSSFKNKKEAEEYLPLLFLNASSVGLKNTGKGEVSPQPHGLFRLRRVSASGPSG